ncbi:hypothetical protein NC652_030853 [Populus alba x Populus x berolinensis]|nr:hypothetical protein NC652_030853 [Populus alba x Populus x berolinensis]
MLSTCLEIICIRLKNIKAYKAEGNYFPTVTNLEREK